MREAAETVRELGLEPWSAESPAERQAWVADLVDRGVLGRADEGPVDGRVGADRVLLAIAKGA
jgi:3-hydroxyisobutyrate dehydrogenase